MQVGFIELILGNESQSDVSKKSFDFLLIAKKKDKNIRVGEVPLG